ncbi:tripartite tricarboxylate transporter substrate-binding protein, partial [Paracidovorax cattleyae]
AALPQQGHAQAPALPDTLRLICGFPAGGGADAITRWVGDKVASVLARAAIVDNRPGAGGRLAVDALRSAAPDGHTILLTPSSVVTMYPYVYAKLGYDPVRDLVPVSQVCDFVHALAVGPAVPASVRTLQDFAAWCSANRTLANCGNTGDGSMPHFLTIMLSRELKTRIEPVPYKGTAPALNDLLGGQLTSLIAPEGSFTPYMSDGRLRLLGTSGDKRSHFFPAVPTFADQGAPSVVVGEWFGMFMPAKTPPAVVARASGAIAAAVRQKDMTDKFAKFGMVNVGSSAEELARRLQADLGFWAPVVKGSGFTPLSS